MGGSAEIKSNAGHELALYSTACPTQDNLPHKICGESPMLMKAQGCLRGRATSPRAGALKLDAGQKIKNKWREPGNRKQ